jgi:hypothetical protein
MGKDFQNKVHNFQILIKLEKTEQDNKFYSSTETN